MAKKNNEAIASIDEISSYLTSVVRGSATSEVLVSEKGQKVCMTKTPDEKEKLKAAQLLYQQLSSTESSSASEETEFVDDIGYEE